MVIKAKKSTNGNSSKTATRIVKAQTQAQGQPKTISKQVLEQQIRECAYYLYLKRGCAPGKSAQDDWIEAEKLVKKELRLN